MKIAPDLQNVMADAELRYPHFTKMARKQLRALLAVAREAKVDVTEHIGSVEDGATMPNTFDASTVRLCRALVRLERVSKEKP